MSKINEEVLSLLSVIGELEDKADILAKEQKDEVAELYYPRVLIEATDILRSLLEERPVIGAQLGGLSLLTGLLARWAKKGA